MLIQSAYVNLYKNDLQKALTECSGNILPPPHGKNKAALVFKYMEINEIDCGFNDL